MSSTNIRSNTWQKGLFASLFITFLFAALNFLPALSLGMLSQQRSALLVGTALAFPSFIMFMALYTGNVSKWRRIFFITFAVGAAVQILWWSFVERGFFWTPDEVTLYGEIPMCHIAVPQQILPLALKKEIIFPVFPVSMTIMLLVIGITAIIYGRAFCSWGCLLGGQDELFSSIGKKRILNVKNPHPFLRYFPFGLLAFTLLVSLAVMTPYYCVWFCPFRVLGDALEVNSMVRAVQAVIFLGLWLGLIVVMPMLTKKRIQCGLFCPMGAFMSLTNKINLFDISVDKEKCAECKRCIAECPTFSMTEESLARGKSSVTCSKCGTCIDNCKEGAIHFRMKGVPFHGGDHPLLRGAKDPGVLRRFIADVWEPRVFFLFGIMMLATSLATPYFVDALSRIAAYFFGV